MTILDLMQQRVPIKKTSARDGGEYHSSCLKCGGEDRFMFWPAAGNFYCRQCEWAGDSITILREIDGLSFRDAAVLVGKELPITDKERHARERVVKERLLEKYFLWSHRKMVESCDCFRELTTEQEIAEIGYRATVRQPDLYTDEEKEYWEIRVAAVYHALPQVEQDCDLLTYDRHVRDRFRWWEEERHE